MHGQPNVKFAQKSFLQFFKSNCVINATKVQSALTVNAISSRFARCPELGGIDF
jgi:hypothetical protein